MLRSEAGFPISPATTGDTIRQHNLLLIHGAWAGAWVWETITPLLYEQGFEVKTIDLPGNGCDDTPAEAVDIGCYLCFLLATIATIDGPLTVVAHSGAGVLATALAEALPERLDGVVIIAGMLLPSGVGFGELVDGMIDAHPEAAGINPYLNWDARNVSTVPADAAREIFFQDLDPETAAQAAQRLCPQPLGGLALVAQWTAERAGSVPRLYIEATEDRSVTLAVQRRMQALVPGSTVVSLRAGHAPQVSQPEAVAAAIGRFVGKLA
ncbi:alpha/beta fold hydrolase [Haliea sp. E17]|uniref:alpha/beta fold hydrolase n=1 Tax=Haliea sp. E17 TaxID=3401576 RepID=UPI003AAFF202